MAGPLAAELADALREVSPALAVEVTESFLQRHPSWRERYGARATSEGVKDAGYHLAFLAGAVETEQPSEFAAYVRWAGRVLAARGIGTEFLDENLQQLRDGLQVHCSPAISSVLEPYFSAAREALASEPAHVATLSLPLTGTVFLQAILTGQRHAAVQIAREALRAGMTLRDLYLDVFQPAMYEVGARWEANRLTVAQEHLATAITQFVMAQVYEPARMQDADKGTILLTGVEGELHSIGAVMVGDLLELAGWRVRFLGTNLPAASVLSMVRDLSPTHVGISATMLFNVGAVRQLIQLIRAEFGSRITLLVGGAAFRTTPDLWKQVSADGFASDLRELQHLLASTR